MYDNIHSLFTYPNVDLGILLYGIWMYAYGSSCLNARAQTNADIVHSSH